MTDAVVEVGRNERVRLLSADGLTDPRNDRTSLDAEFAIFNDLSDVPDTFMPQPSGQGEIEPATIRFLDLYRVMLNEMEGRLEYSDDVAAIP